MRRPVWLGAVLLAGLGGWQSAGAQIGPSGFVEDSGTALNRHLKELADSPRSLSALLGAAKAALELGDPQAAVTFYARAEQIAPRDGRIKAGIGAAFLAMEQPAPALKFLEEARGLGLPEGVIAADRGLAHDLLGDPAQAQRDYLIAMRVNDNDELRRRLALSRAISGDRGGALAAIEDQVRRNSPAGRRVRAFVLALTGDVSGATDVARLVMPAQAAAMQPFFARLPQLRPVERAAAVHFGRFPGDPPPGQTPTPLPNYAALPPNIVLGGRPDPNQPAFAARTPAPTPPPAEEQRTQLAARVDPPVRTVAPPSAAAASSLSRTTGPTIVAPTPGSVQGPPDGASRPSRIVSGPAAGSIPAPTPGISVIDLPASEPAVPVRSAESAPLPTERPAATASGAPTQSPQLPGLAGVAATIRSLAEPGERAAPEQQLALNVARPEAPAPASVAPSSAEPAAAEVGAPLPAASTAPEASPVLLAKRTEVPVPGANMSRPAKPPPPRRFWVQLGGKPDEAALLAEFQRLKGRAKELLGDKAAWTAPADAASSRLLVGPFKTRDDADLFVQLLDEEGLRATAWTSQAGQEIVKLAAK